MVRIIPFHEVHSINELPLQTTKGGAPSYCHETSWTWDITNPAASAYPPESRLRSRFAIITVLRSSQNPEVWCESAPPSLDRASVLFPVRTTEFFQVGANQPEDFPIMPAEPVTVMLRASNLFLKNPELWVPLYEKAMRKTFK